MKNILKKIYSYPVISAITLNLLNIVIGLNLIDKDNYYLIIPLVCVIRLNKAITDKGIGLTKGKQIMIFISFFLMISINFLFNKYINFFNFK